MILQSLAKYYERLSRDTSEKTAPPGFQKKEIHFVLVLNTDGSLADIQDTRTILGKKKSARQFMVPREVKRAVNIEANLLWDNIEYTLGELSDTKYELAMKKKGGAKKAEQEREKAKNVQLPTFVRHIDELSKECDDTGLKAVLAFLRSHINEVKNHPHWAEIKKGGVNISFRLAEENCLVCERSKVFDAIGRGTAMVGESDFRGTCLVTGNVDSIVRLHASIRGVAGAQSSGANIVSFNLPAFCSYGKEQSFNAPVGKTAEFAYTTALNTLLKKESRQKIPVGGTTTVFWAEQEHDLEKGFASIFGFGDDGDADKEASARKRADYIRALLMAPDSGHRPKEDKITRFYVLGLSPNASRLSVRFWYAGAVAEIEQNIRTHFEDMAIIHSEKEDEFPRLWFLLKSLALNGEVDK